MCRRELGPCWPKKNSKAMQLYSVLHIALLESISAPTTLTGKVSRVPQTFSWRLVNLLWLVEFANVL